VAAPLAGPEKVADRPNLAKAPKGEDDDAPATGASAAAVAPEPAVAVPVLSTNPLPDAVRRKLELRRLNIKMCDMNQRLH